MKSKKCHILLLLILPVVCLSQNAIVGKTKVNIDMDKSTGVIRPLHGGNNGPISNLKVLDFSDFFEECKIPLTRLHDVTWSNTHAVDISTIFRDFRNDPTDADSYDFRQTDDYIAGIINTGANIIYRLGESIEWTKNKYNVNPPSNNEKWAAICCGIIRHYNEGWANGFHYNIKYWEIWNEADCRSGNWTGTDEQYLALYGTAAKEIKRNFPGIKVGGPAIGCSINLKEGPAANSGFLDKFLNYCQADSVPLDFFSWHWYHSNPWKLTPLPQYVRAQLDHYGFVKTESILDEWNYKPGNDWSGSSQIGAPRVKWYEEQNSVRGGAFIADVLMLLQDEPVDQANLYTISNGEFGLFSDMGIIHKSAYAFKAFANLVNNTPIRIETKYNKDDSLVICTGTNAQKTELAILVSNISLSAKEINFTLSNNFLAGRVSYELYVVDETHNFSKVKGYSVKNNGTLRITEKIEGPSVVLLKCISGR